MMQNSAGADLGRFEVVINAVFPTPRHCYSLPPRGRSRTHAGTAPSCDALHTHAVNTRVLHTAAGPSASPAGRMFLGSLR
jgi:hypothetical protein